MKKITKKIVTIILFAAVPALLFMFNLPLSADETLITIANDSELNYRKPDVQITSSGTVYVSYAAEVPDPNEVIEEIEGPHGRSSDIHLSKYEGGIVSFVKNVSESSADSYESEIAIGSNGYIHVAWCDERNGTHTILYRYYNGSSWSNITTLGSETGISYIWDLRMAVDNSGNVFVVYMKWGTAKCMFISKYGNDISFEAFPLGGRAKHPDVAVDNNYVHIVRQYRDSGSDPYTAMYNRRANQRGSSWEGAIDLDYNNVQKPRISIGSDNVPHVVFFENFGTYRTLWYKKWNGSKFDTLTEMSDSSGEYTHHFPDLIVLDSDNILATMQRGAAAGGKAIYYRWKKSGTWSGFSFFGESNGKKPSKFSVDMKNVGENLIAALAFAQSDDAVQLVLASSGSTGPSTQTPVASFTYTPQIGHMPLNVTCDAQLSSDPDGTIVSYQWAFGDGTSSTGISAQHTYTTQGQYTILLTVTDNDGLTNQVSQVVVVEPPNENPVAAFIYSPQIGHVPLTVACNASSSSDPDGSITQYYWDFGDGSVKQGRIVQHQYTIHDDYNIELTVTDDDGATTTVSHPVVVEPPNQPPTCSFTFSPTSGLYPLVVTFDTSQCTDSDGQIASYRWDFGDATFGGGAAPTHQYNQKGTYTVKLKLTDDDGATSTATGTIQVFGLMPPINVAYELKENRSLFTINYVTRVTWNMNPVNADHGATIVQYKIFRKLPSESNYALHTEVAAQDFNEYYDRLGSESIIYNYVVIAVDDHGRMSEFPSTYNSYRERKPRRIRE